MSPRITEREYKQLPNSSKIGLTRLEIIQAKQHIPDFHKHVGCTSYAEGEHTFFTAKDVAAFAEMLEEVAKLSPEN